MNSVSPGQRWINIARPELGLGLVTDHDARTVTLRFGDLFDEHVFAIESAPLSRIRFSPGDVIRTFDGAQVVIERVDEAESLLIYSGHDSEGAAAVVVESSIASDQSFNRPVERLLHGHIDDGRWFALRYRTLMQRHRLLGDPVWGLRGGRTALLPHQLYVANEVARRHAPRVLLADEVGLGKTIEAGMVAHYQLLTERIRRVLVVVPESLCHQWLVEMLRRFNLKFSLFDRERCDAMDGTDTDADDSTPSGRNPFEEEQQVIVSRDFLLNEPHRLDQCVSAGWDLLMIDEAHHLHVDESGPGPAYRMAESLAAVSSGVLLLTGTPRQLGISGHFSRLRLLDPNRYFDVADLKTEQERFAPLAELIESLGSQQTLPEALWETIDAMDMREAVEAVIESGYEQRQCDAVIDQLLDRYGTGRVMFRNTRASVKGFPDRRLQSYALEHADLILTDDELTDLELALYPERRLLETGDVEGWLKSDPRIEWLHQFLKNHAGEKALVICHHRSTAANLAAVLGPRYGIGCAAFHEDMSLLERDRAAAWFADSDEGCQALMTSEIGSEGRNFQFAQHLVLFDLPLSPDLLEQRIGRLDRIGRRQTVEVHSVFLQGSAQHRLFNWFHEGLEAFERSGPANTVVHDNNHEAIINAVIDASADLDTLIATSKSQQQDLEKQMREGRDRLLEYQSCRPERASCLIEAAMSADQDRSLVDWLEQVSTCLDISIEPYRSGSILIKPGTRLAVPIAGLDEDGLAATFDRTIALENEDLAFLTLEHPFIEALSDVITNAERGNVALCGFKHAHLARGKLAVECAFVVETGPLELPELAHYLPPMLLPAIYHEDGHRLDDALDHEQLSRGWLPLKPKASRKIVALRREELERTLKLANDDIEARAHALIREHAQAGLDKLQAEYERLKYLKSVNPSVRDEELGYYQKLLDSAHRAVASPRARLDALRVIVGL